MAETFQLYVKNTSNCEGLPLQVFERLGPEWTGDSVTITFYDEDDNARRLEVVGWTDLYTGQACPVHVGHVRWLPHTNPDISGGPWRPQEGYMVWGGNSGVRALDPEAEAEAGAEHLPPGHGYPIVWVALEDLPDLPQHEVRDIITRAICQHCRAILPLSASPYWLGEGRKVWLCDGCAAPEGDDPPPSRYPPPTSERPTLAQLEEWHDVDGGCEATDGCWVEPDGTCEHGHPSWLLRLGLI